MKKYLSLMTFLICSGMVLFWSCSKDDNAEGDGNKTPVTKPILSVTAKDGTHDTNAVVADGGTKTIVFTLKEVTDLKEVKVAFTLADGVTLVNPVSNPAVVDLSKTVNVKISNGGKDEIYKMSATSNALLDFVKKAEATIGGSAVDAAVDNQLRTISVPYNGGAVGNVVLNLTLLDGTTVKTPENKTFDLSAGAKKLVLVYDGVEAEYSVQLSGINIDPAAKGWSLSSSYTGLPDYVKVYTIDKTDVMLPQRAPGAGDMAKGVKAYVAIADASKIEIELLGGGKNAKTTVPAQASAHPEAIILLNGADGGPALMVNGGNIIQGPAGSVTNARAAFGVTTAGECQFTWAYDLAGKVYSFKNGLGELSTPPTVNSPGAAVWDVKVAFGGLPMIMKDGKVFSDGDHYSHDGNSAFCYNNYTRSAIGITLDNKLVFFVSEQGNPGGEDPEYGLTLPQVAVLLQQLGCYHAMALEGYDSTNMYVKGKKTINTIREQQGEDQKPVDYVVMVKSK